MDLSQGGGQLGDNDKALRDITGGQGMFSKAVVDSFPLEPFATLSKRPPQGNSGPCDDGSVSFREIETALDVARYSSVFVRLQRSAGGDIFVASSATPLQWFQAGNQQSAAGTGLVDSAGANTIPLTRAETDAYDGGALAANQSQNFRVVGVMVEVEFPFLTATIGADVGGRRYLDVFTAYFAHLVRALSTSAHFRFTFGNSQMGYEMGRICFWPSMSQKLSAQGVSFGNPRASAFIPLRLPTYGGAFNDDNQLDGELIIDRSFQVDAIGGAPVPALVGATQYLLPVTLQLVGEPVATGVSAKDIADEAEARILRKLAAVMEGSAGPNDAAMKLRGLLSSVTKK